MTATELLREQMHRVIRAAIYSVFVPDAGGYCTKEGKSSGASVEDVWEELRYSVEALTGRKVKDGKAGWITERTVKNLADRIDALLSQPEPQAMSAEDCCCAIHHPNYGRCLQCPIHGSPPPDLSRKEKA